MVIVTEMEGEKEVGKKRKDLSRAQAIHVLTIAPMQGPGESHFTKKGNETEFALSCPSSDLPSVPRVAEVQGGSEPWPELHRTTFLLGSLPSLLWTRDLAGSGTPKPLLRQLLLQPRCTLPLCVGGTRLARL